MVRHVRARYRHGRIEPQEELNLREGEEVTILVEDAINTGDAEAQIAFERAAGSWEGLMDFDQFLTELQLGRQRQQRPPVDLP